MEQHCNSFIVIDISSNLWHFSKPNKIVFIMTQGQPWPFNLTYTALAIGLQANWPIYRAAVAICKELGLYPLGDVTVTGALTIFLL